MFTGATQIVDLVNGNWLHYHCYTGGAVSIVGRKTMLKNTSFLWR